MVINSSSLLSMEKSKQRKQCPELQKIQVIDPGDIKIKPE